MNLSQADCERFYRIWFRLLRHVNLQEQIIPELPEDPKAGIITRAKNLRPVDFPGP